MNRTTLIRTASFSRACRPLGAILGLLVALGALGAGCRKPPSPPSTAERWRVSLGELASDELNVILITIDTLRADHLSSYGSRLVQTPNIDRLANDGVRFANAATTVPFTLPAHSSLMTGTYPPFHGVRENVGYTLDESLPTLAQVLADGGWSTAGFVSAFVLDSRWGIGRGFDTYHDRFELEPGGGTNLAAVQRDGAETIDAAIAWLDSRPDPPLFLWLHLFDPHDPYRPPEPYRSQYRHPYAAEVAYTDSLIGRFRDALEARGLLDRSLLVLTGDHGEGLGQHEERFHGFFLYDSTVHVPLVVRTPSVELGGRVVDAAVSHVDILPTVLEATGQTVPTAAQGRSLLPLILGLDESSEPERQVYSESLYPLLHYGWSPLRSLRSRRYKFIDAPRPELYDLEADPGEEVNALLDQRQTSRQLKDALDVVVDHIEQGGVSAQPADVDEETRRQLMALGYVAGRGGVTTEAIDDRDRADPKDRIRLHQLVMAAQSDMGAEDLDAAESKLEEALAVDPSLLDAQQMLGTIALERAQYDSALERFQAALALDSDHVASVLGLATAYRALDRVDEALVGYRRVLELDAANSSAALGAADLLIAAGQADEAIVLLEAAVQTGAPPPILFNRLGELIVADGQLERAAELFRTAIAGNDELVPAHFNLAVLLEEEGQIEAAMASYERAIELAPDNYQALFNLGRLLGERRQVERQAELYRRAIEANPDFVRGYFYLAKLLMDTGGDLDEAERLTRSALDRDPNHRTGPFGYFVLADILNRQGRREEASRAVAKGREIEAESG